MLSFRMLGTLEIQGRWETAAPATPKIAGVLALFLCRPNQIVNTSVIMEELWGDEAPKTASATTHTYVYRLRKLLQHLDPVDYTDDRPLETRPPGYVLHVGDDQVDAFAFERLASKGRELLEQGCTEEAATALYDAIHLWRGPALTNAACGQVVQAHVAQLRETFIHTRELHIQAMFSLGRHQEVVSDLKMLANKHPLNEWIHGRLIQALTVSGRRSEALLVYRKLKSRLAEELGIDPSPNLQHLEARVAAGPIPLLGPALDSGQSR